MANAAGVGVRTADDALRLLQGQYYDSIDALDIEAAVCALHEEVEFNQVPVWRATDLQIGSNVLSGRPAVLAFLTRAKPRLKLAGIRHRVEDIILDGSRGALRAHVEGPDGEQAPFMVWFEIEDDLVRRYFLRPV